VKKMMSDQFLSKLEYIFIFDYYDQPLFFISKNSEDKKYYLFYSIDDNVYFFSDLSASDVDYFFKKPSGLEIINYLMDKSKMQLLLIDGETPRIENVSNYNQIFSEDISEALPDAIFPVEYDYVNKVSFDTIKENYKSYFDSLYDNDQLTLRIKDPNNSSTLDISIIYTVINFVNNTWEDISDRYTELGNKKRLKMAAPASGSLKLEFELDSNEQINFFESDASFSMLFSFIDNLSYNPIYDKDKLIEDRKMIDEAAKLYEVIEKNNLSIDFISNDIKMSNLKKSEKIKSNLNNLVEKVEEEITRKTTTIEQISVDGEVLAANKSKNYFKIQSVASGDISGIFEKNLFKKIKSSEKQITISKKISASITKQTTTNIDTNETKVKYILDEFTQP